MMRRKPRCLITTGTATLCGLPQSACDSSDSLAVPQPAGVAVTADFSDGCERTGWDDSAYACSESVRNLLYAVMAQALGNKLRSSMVIYQREWCLLPTR